MAHAGPNTAASMRLTNSFNAETLPEKWRVGFDINYSMFIVLFWDPAHGNKQP